MSQTLSPLSQGGPPRTNTLVNLAVVLLAGCAIALQQVFQAAKATFDTRPIFHSDDAAIRGHVFCSFLALVLQKELADRCEAAGLRPEWAEVLRDLDRLQQATIDKDGKRITTRTAVSGQVGSLFKAAGVALPPNMREQTAA